VADARLDLARDLQPTGGIAGEDRGRQAVLGVVRDADRVVLVSGADPRDDGAEALLRVEPHLRGDAVDPRAGTSTPFASPAETTLAPLATASSTIAASLSVVFRSTTAASGGLLSRVSPAARVRTLAANFWTKASATASTTMIRSVDMQI
jgi:hypothetical protein